MKREKPWWSLDLLDGIFWVLGAFIVFRFFTGVPEGLTGWIVWFVCASAGWFGMALLHHWWKRR